MFWIGIGLCKGGGSTEGKEAVPTWQCKRGDLFNPRFPLSVSAVPFKISCLFFPQKEQTSPEFGSRAASVMGDETEGPSVLSFGSHARPLSPR